MKLKSRGRTEIYRVTSENYIMVLTRITTAKSSKLEVLYRWRGVPNTAYKSLCFIADDTSEQAARAFTEDKCHAWDLHCKARKAKDAEQNTIDQYPGD